MVSAITDCVIGVGQSSLFLPGPLFSTFSSLSKSACINAINFVRMHLQVQHGTEHLIFLNNGSEP